MQMVRFTSRRWVHALALTACTLAVFGLATAPLVGQLAERKTQLQVYPQIQVERADALYRPGEKANFAIRFEGKDLDDPDWEARYELSQDGYGKLASGPVPRQGMSVGGTLQASGFLRCRVIVTWKKAEFTNRFAAAAFAPGDLKPSLPVPDDFDAFWADQLKALRAHVAEPKLTPVPSPDDSVECFDLRIDLPSGRPMTGYLALPRRAADASLPAVLVIDGSYIRSAQLKEAVEQAKRGRLAIHMNPHGVANGLPQADYDKLVLPGGDLCKWVQDGLESRDKVYYRNVVLRVVRALDFLKAHKAWDGKRLAVTGASMGGGLAVMAGGLDPRVCFVGAAVPWLCDHSARVVKRTPSQPALVPDNLAGTLDPTILKTMRYYDTVNFATRVKAETMVTMGMCDIICPPTSVQVLYNALDCRKQLLREPTMGHDHPPRLAEQFEKAMANAFARCP